MENCQNCGHSCHCKEICTQKVINEFNKSYDIECCKQCRHNEEKK